MGIPHAHHPETVEHIEQQHDDGQGGKACGCLRDKRGEWMLCAFHDGYDEGVDLIYRALNVGAVQ